MTPSPNCQLQHNRTKQRGFTMMELLVSMVIIVILASLAAPSMREMSIGSVLKANTNDIVTALNLARAEAVKRGSDVAVIAQAGGWNAGWIIQPVGTTETLVSHAAIARDYRILGAASGGGAPSDRVIFTGTGALRTATSFDFSVCRPSFSPGDEESRRVIVSATGTVRSRRDTTSSPAGSCA